MRETTIVARRRPLFAPNWFHRRMKSGPVYSRGEVFSSERGQQTWLTKPVVFYIIAVKITRVISAHYFWPLLIHGRGRNGGSRVGLDWCPTNHYAPLIYVFERLMRPTITHAALSSSLPVEKLLRLETRCYYEYGSAVPCKDRARILSLSLSPLFSSFSLSLSGGRP